MDHLLKVLIVLESLLEEGGKEFINAFIPSRYGPQRMRQGLARMQS